MNTMLKISFVGGDKRIVTVAKEFSRYGFEVKVWGIDNTYFDEPDICADTCENAVKDARILVLPTPPSEDEVRINCPLFSSESGVKFHKLLDMLSQDTVILGGRMSPRIRDIATKRNFKIFDYFNREELLIKNAVPTAEGAIGIAIEKMSKTVFGAKIAVIGYGRIGEVLASRLRLLGADVTVYARKTAAIAKAQSEGLNGRRIEYINGQSSLIELAKGYNLIYNTVPYWIITEEIIKEMPKSTLFVDLASAPGGVDILAAKKYGLNVIHALGLPGKTAPDSAGMIIAESILNIIKEECFL